RAVAVFLGWLSRQHINELAASNDAPEPQPTSPVPVVPAAGRSGVEQVHDPTPTTPVPVVPTATPDTRSTNGADRLE
ncbi:MAG: hypothetical protein ACYC2O_12240, partial [Microthrixaceae bacterium]